MDAWVRNLIVIVVMIVWSIYCIVTLIRGGTIEVYWVSLPAAVYFALNPNFRRPGNGDKKSGESQ